MSNLQTYITRQIELKKIMASSDAYAAKCAKLGLSFKETYPEKYNEYTQANDEYNRNQIEMAPLIEKEQREERERILKIKRDICEQRNASGKYPGLKFIIVDE